MNDVSPEILREFLTYDPDTGLLFWKFRDRKWFKDDRFWKTWNSRFTGKQAFTAFDANGYLHGRIFMKAYKAHRVAWCITFGSWPENQIDHIDGVRSNNCITNLRDVTASENRMNMKKPVTNTSGFVGVGFDPNTHRWTAQIQVSGKCKYLGNFRQKKDAMAARKAAEVKYGFHANHGMR